MDAQYPILPLLILAPYLLYFFGRLGQYYVLRMLGREAPFDREMHDRGESVLLGQSLRQVFAWTTGPIYRALAASRVSPNFLTLLCLVISFAAGALIAFGHVALGGAVGMVGSSLDFFDGRVARQTGRATRAGGFLDSTLDRYCDIAFLSGAAVLFRTSVPVLVACLLGMGAAVVISYTRAKAESLGVSLKVGLMQRPERVVVFCLGAFLDPYVEPLLPEAWQGRHALFAAAIVLLATLSVITTIHRTYVGFRTLQREDG
ncbi:MAG: CDP-alcohol phosphatidyltransferase family protein [Acidobacteriota bacterium]